MLTKNQQLLKYWICERESIRQLKMTDAPKPWSSDPIFQQTYFTNVNREEDKVTKWIRQNWTYDMSMNVGAYETAMFVARIFNKIETLEKLKNPAIYYSIYDFLSEAKDILEYLKGMKIAIWNGAYIISTNGRKIDKLTYCLNLIENLAFEPEKATTADCSSLAEAHRKLMGIEGLASFLAAQIVADLKNTSNHHLSSAKDWWTFSSHGPGSLRGLSWFWEEKVTPKNYHLMIAKANEILQWELNDDILDILCMQNLQNCFCEFDKYMRILNKTGKSKRKYAGA